MRIDFSLSKLFSHFKHHDVATTKKQGCIDRFEGNFAVIDFGEGKTVDMPKSSLPKGAKEGIWMDLEMKGDKVVKATVNQAKTDAMAAEIKKLTEDLFEN